MEEDQKTRKPETENEGIKTNASSSLYFTTYGDGSSGSVYITIL